MEPPAFPHGLATVRAAPGSPATILLSTPAGTPPFNYHWSRAGASLDDRFTTSEDARGVTLTVSAARTGDSGVYTLQASNAAGRDSARVRMEVSPDEEPVGEDPPTFLRRLQDLTVKVGTRTRFLVEIVSSTECRVTWYRNERRLMEAERIGLARDGNFWCADVAAVSVDDAGRWTCTAENAGGRASCSAHLNVLVPKAYKRPEFVEELRALLTEQGTVSLECKVVGVPTPVLRWFKDSREIKAGDVFALTANAEDPTSLGTYTCEAVNCMGRAYSSSKVHVVGRASREGSTRPSSGGLTPEPPPIFTKELEGQFVKISSPLTLSCHIVVPPWPRSVVWYNKEGKVEPSERYHVIEDGVGGYLLELVSAEFPDEGEWKCVATSAGGRVGISTCYVTMDVPKNYRKPRFMENLQAVLTEEGLVSFECKVVGFPTPVLSWFKDGQELKPGDVYQLTGTNSLGSYCCIARNCMGQASSSAELTVEDIQNQLNEEEKLQLFSKNQAPKFVLGLKSLEAKIDEPFRFMIKVAIPPEPSVLWYRDDQPVDESTRCHLTKEERGNFSLDITNLEFLDQAEWKCVAMNDYGHSVTSCFLKLTIPRHYKKPRFLENLQAILSDEGAVNLECKVIGVPQPVLKWYKDGEELKPGDIHRIISGQDGTCCLGTYTCEARNCMGIAASSASLLGFEESMKQNAKKKAEEQALQRNLSLSTIHEERTSQMYDTPVGDITLDDKGEISFSFDGKEVSVSLYETPDLTEEEALQIVEMYADQLSENVTEHNVVELPPLRFVKETSTSGNLLMEAIIIDVSPEYFTSPDEDLRTEADVEDISIAEENGFPHLSLDQDIGGENYLEKTIAMLSDEKADIPKKLARLKSESMKSGEDFFSLSRDPSLSEDKKEDDTQVMSVSELRSYESAHSISKGVSKSVIKTAEPTPTAVQEPLTTAKTISQNELDRKTQETGTPAAKPKRERRSSRGSRRSSSGSEKSASKARDELLQRRAEVEPISKPPISDEEFKLKITDTCSCIEKVINDVQIIEREIILKSELMSSAATASRSLEIISSLISPLSEIHSIAEAGREAVSESKPLRSSLFTSLPQSLKTLQQSLTIIEKCIDVESETKTLVKKTCVAFIESCGIEVQKLMSGINTLVKANYLVLDEKTISDLDLLTHDINHVVSFTAETIKTRKIIGESTEIKPEEPSVESHHLKDTQKAVFELKSPLSSLLCIAESAKSCQIVDISKVKSSEVILTDMSASIQDLQSALEQIELLSVKESTTPLHKYNTEIIESVVESVLKLRSSFERLSTETKIEEDKTVLMDVLASIKQNLNELSLQINTIENNVGTFDILQSDNKLEVLQKMAQILIALENNIPRLEQVPEIKTHMSLFHKNLTKVLENVIESNEAKKYFTLIEICNVVNRVNSAIKNIDTDTTLSLASLCNTMRIIKDYFIKNIFESELNCTILNNIADVYVGLQEALTNAEEISVTIDSEHIEDITSQSTKATKAKVTVERIGQTIAAINNVKMVESLGLLKTTLSPVFENICPILEELRQSIASEGLHALKADEHVSEISEAFVQTLATPVCDLHENIIVLNRIVSENVEILKENSELSSTVAVPLQELRTTLVIMQQDVISQCEDLIPHELSVKIANAVQDLQSCILIIEERDEVEGAEDLSTLEDISGIKTTADTIPSDRLVLPSVEETAAQSPLEPLLQSEALSATALALQSLNEHIYVLQSAEVIDALDTLSEVSDYSSLKSVALGLGDLYSGIEEILHPVVLENTAELKSFVNTTKLSAIAEPMQDLQQSLSILDTTNIPIYEHILEMSAEKIHSVFLNIFEFKEQLEKCIQAVFPAMETADKTIEISNKVETLRVVCENLKDIIENTQLVSREVLSSDDMVNLDKSINNLLDATDVSKGIKIEIVKSITEELFAKVLTVQEDVLRFTPQAPEYLAQEARFIQTIDEVASNIAVLEQYEFVDLSRASDLTSCASPQLATEFETNSLLQMNNVVDNAVNVLHDLIQERSEADFMIVDDFFRTCKNEFTILKVLLTKKFSHKKMIRLLQEFSFLQQTISNFRMKQAELSLSDEMNSYVSDFLLNADEHLKNIQVSLTKVVEAQSDVLFLQPIKKIYEATNLLKEIKEYKELKPMENVIISLENVISLATLSIPDLKNSVLDDIKNASFETEVINVSLVEKMEDLEILVQETALYSLNEKSNNIVINLQACIQKHSDFKDATGSGKALIILKCLTECIEILKEEDKLTPTEIIIIEPKVEDSPLKLILTEMITPLQSLQNQLSYVQDQISSGVDEDAISVDITSTISIMHTITEICKEIVHIEEQVCEGTIVGIEDMALVMEVDREIHNIHDGFKSIENIPVAKMVLNALKPVELIEISLKSILSSDPKSDKKGRLSKDKSTELLQHIDQYIELTEIVEEISAIIREEELQESVNIAKELRESIAASEDINLEAGGEVSSEVRTEQARLATQLHEALSTLQVHAIEKAHEIGQPVIEKTLLRITETASQLQTNLVAVTSVESAINDTINITSDILKVHTSEDTKITLQEEKHATEVMTEESDSIDVKLNKSVDTYYGVGQSTSKEKDVVLTNDIISKKTQESEKGDVMGIFQELAAERRPLQDHIDELLSDEVSETVTKLADAISAEHLIKSFEVAQELRENIAAFQTLTDTSEANSLIDITIATQGALKQEVFESIVLLKEVAFETIQEIDSSIRPEHVLKLTDILTHLQDNLVSPIPSVVTDVKLISQVNSTPELSMKDLNSLLQEVNEKIILSPEVQSADDMNSLVDILDEVQTVLIKLKCDYDGSANDTLNETLEDLECSVRSFQLQISEESPPAMLKEACVTLQLLINNMSEVYESSKTQTSVKITDKANLLNQCVYENDKTLELLDLASNIQTDKSNQLDNILSGLDHIKENIKFLKLGFTGNAESVVENGIDILQRLNQIEDQLFSLEKDVENAGNVSTTVKDTVITAVHSVYGSISNMRSTISSIQKQYMHENYGKPSESILHSIKYVSFIAQAWPSNTDIFLWKNLSKSLRNVFKHFEDIKFYINFDKTARLPSDAAFTKIILDDLISNLSASIFLLATMQSQDSRDVKNTLEILKNIQHDIENRNTLDVKEKIPMFKKISAGVSIIVESFKDEINNKKELISSLSHTKMEQNLRLGEGVEEVEFKDIEYKSIVDTSEHPIISDVVRDLREQLSSLTNEEESEINIEKVSVINSVEEETSPQTFEAEKEKANASEFASTTKTLEDSSDQMKTEMATEINRLEEARAVASTSKEVDKTLEKGENDDLFEKEIIFTENVIAEDVISVAEEARAVASTIKEVDKTLEKGENYDLFEKEIILTENVIVEDVISVAEEAWAVASTSKEVDKTLEKGKNDDFFEKEIILTENVIPEDLISVAEKTNTDKISREENIVIEKKDDVINTSEKNANKEFILVEEETIYIEQKPVEMEITTAQEISLEDEILDINQKTELKIKTADEKHKEEKQSTSGIQDIKKNILIEEETTNKQNTVEIEMDVANEIRFEEELAAAIKEEAGEVKFEVGEISINLKQGPVTVDMTTTDDKCIEEKPSTLGNKETKREKVINEEKATDIEHESVKIEMEVADKISVEEVDTVVKNDAVQCKIDVEEETKHVNKIPVNLDMKNENETCEEEHSSMTNKKEIIKEIDENEAISVQKCIDDEEKATMERKQMEEKTTDSKSKLIEEGLATSKTKYLDQEEKITAEENRIDKEKQLDSEQNNNNNEEKEAADKRIDEEEQQAVVENKRIEDEAKEAAEKEQAVAEKKGIEEEQVLAGKIRINEEERQEAVETKRIENIEKETATKKRVEEEQAVVETKRIEGEQLLAQKKRIEEEQEAAVENKRIDDIEKEAAGKSRVEREQAVAEQKRMEEEQVLAENKCIEEKQQAVEETKRIKEVKKEVAEKKRVEEEHAVAEIKLIKEAQQAAAGKELIKEEEQEALEKNPVEEEKVVAENKCVEEEQVFAEKSRIEEVEKKAAEKQLVKEEQAVTEKKRIEEEQQAAAEKSRIKEVEKEAAEKKRVEEQKTVAENKRVEEEQVLAQMKRIEEEHQEAAEMKRIKEVEEQEAEKKRDEEEQAWAKTKRIEEQQAFAEKSRIKEVENNDAERKLVKEEQAVAEMKRIDEEQLQAQTKRIEEEQQAAVEKSRIKEVEKEAAEIKRVEEEKAVAENKRIEEEQMLAEKKRIEEERQVAAEMKRIKEVEEQEADKKRVEEEKAVAENKRIEEEQMLAEKKRIEEERQVAAEMKRIKEVEEQEAEKKRVEEEKAVAENKRIEEEQMLAEKKRIEEEQQVAAEMKRIEEVEEQEAEKKRVEEEKAVAENKRIEEEQMLAEKKRIEEERQVAAEMKRIKEVEEQEADKKRVEEEKAVAENKRIEEEQMLAEKKRIEEERQVAAEMKRIEEVEEHEAEKKRVEEEQAVAKTKCIEEQQAFAEKSRIKEVEKEAAKKKRVEEEKAVAEKKRIEEEQMLAEKKRVEEKQQLAAEMKRIKEVEEHEAEKKRVEEEQAVAKTKRIEEQQAFAEKSRIEEVEEQEAEKKRVEEEKAVAEMKRIDEEQLLARTQRIEEEQQAAVEKSRIKEVEKETAEKKRVEEEKAVAENKRIEEEQMLAEKKRIEEEQQVAAEIKRIKEVEKKTAEKQRVEEEEAVAKKKRIQVEKQAAAEIKRVEEENAAREKKRVEEEQAVAEKKRIEEEQLLAEKKRIDQEQQAAAEKKLIKGKEAADKIRVEEEQAVAEKKRIEEEQLLAKQKRIEVEKQAAAEKKLFEEEKAIAEMKRFEEEQLAAAEKKRAHEEQAIAETKRNEEEQVLAEKKRFEEELVLAEKKRIEEKEAAEKKRVEEEQAVAEEKRIQEKQEAAEKIRIEKEQQAAAADKRRVDEEQAVAAKKRIEEEQEAAEKIRIEEEQQAAAKQKRINEENEAAEKKRVEQEEAVAEKKRIDEERQAAQKKCIEEEQVLAEKKRIEVEKQVAAEKKRVEEEKVVAGKKRMKVEEKLASEKKRIAEEKSVTDKKRIQDEEKARKKRIDEQEKLAEEKKRVEDEKLTVEKKLIYDEEKTAAEKILIEKKKAATEKKRMEDEIIAAEENRREMKKLAAVKKRNDEEKDFNDRQQIQQEKTNAEKQRRKEEKAALEKKRNEEDIAAEKKKLCEKEKFHKENTRILEEKAIEKKKRIEEEEISSKKKRSERKKAALEKYSIGEENAVVRNKETDAEGAVNKRKEVENDVITKDKISVQTVDSTEKEVLMSQFKNVPNADTTQHGIRQKPRKEDKPKFIDRDHKDYTMEFERPSNYREKELDRSDTNFESFGKNITIYKAQSILLESQLRSSVPLQSEFTRSTESADRRSDLRRSKALSEARSMVSDKRSSMSRDSKRKPVFSTYLTDRTAVEGSRVKLTCSVLTSSDPNITWYKNGAPLNNKLKYRTKYVDGLITMEVLNAEPSDSSEYSCNVENDNGAVSTSAILKVYPSFEASPIPPTFTRSIRDTYHLAENELVLECRIRGQPLPTISWLKNDKPVGINERYQAYYLADGVCRLAINNPTTDDNGKYTCKAENSVWSDQITHIVNFTGNEHRLSPNLATIEKSRFNRYAMESRRPHFTNVLTDCKVAKGGTIGLQVEIKGFPTRVEWLREGKEVTEVYRHAKTFVEKGLYTLALSDVTEKETGMYTCRAWSSHGNVDMNAAITVVQPNELEGKPAIIAGRPEKDILISVGEDVNISFRVQGEPKPKVVFMKGTRDITNSQRVCKMTSDDYVKFTLKRSVVSDAGTYCILTRNAYGCDRAFVTVVVRQRASSENLISDWTYPLEETSSSTTNRGYKSVPERIPGEPSVVDGGNNWVSIVWSKPEPSEAAPVLAYKVDSWLLGKEGGARWVELGITPLNAFDAFHLKQGEQYHFRVTPKNRFGWGESSQTSSPVGVGVAGERPEFVDILPGQLKVLLGETANLTCTVRGKPVPEVVWMRNGHEVEEEDQRLRMSSDGSVCSLVIKNINEEDEARYSCEASNEHGRASTYARLAVVTDRQIWEADAKLKRERSSEVLGEYPPQFTMRLRDRRVQATYPVRLTCQVVGNPSPNVTWFKDGQSVTLDSRRAQSQDEHFHTLEIAPTHLEDGGVYEAMARNGCGAVSCRCSLVVDKGIRAYIAPDFCCGLEPLYRINEGEELRISAVVEAYPSVGVTWFRDGVRLRPSRRAIMTLDRDGQIELALAFVTDRDAGVYSCIASNEVGRATTSGKVIVIGNGLPMEKKRTPPMLVSPDVPYSKEPMFIRKPRSSEAREGDTVIIQCEVVGDPKPDVYWLRDFLKPDYYRDASHFKRVGSGSEYRFEIPHAKFDYTGTYSVVAKNVHGEAKAIISLQILAKDPSASDDSHNVRYGRSDVLARFERELTDLLCHDGDAVEFECRVTGEPMPDVRWFHYSDLIRDCEYLETTFEDGTARLKIRQVTGEDEGNYCCEASNSLGKATSSACLVVYSPGEPNTLSQRLRRPPALSAASTPRSTPARSMSRATTPAPVQERRMHSPSRQMAPKFYTYPPNKVVDEGDSVVFQCAVKGLPSPWATWDKDGVIITPSARISIKEKDDMLRILEIEEVSIEDVGLYRITLENDYGRVEASARLEVISHQGKFHAGVRAYSASPRRALAYRRRSSTSRQD